MESEQSQNFNDRLSQWVASQGFWFQIRYSMSGSGSKGTAVFHLMRLGFRLLVLLLIVAAGGWVYLMKRTESKGFFEDMQSAMNTGLSAKESEMKGFRRAQGEMQISRFASQGGEGTFFTSLEARGIRGEMNLLDGLTGKWDPGMITIAKLDLELRAGADDPQSAEQIAKALYRKSEKIEIGGFLVKEASLRWGYSERLRGSIDNSEMKVQRLTNGWRASFKGGTFSQNWLNRLDIVNLVVSCDPEGVLFEKAELRRGSGTVDFSGLRVRGGELPEIDGLAKIRGLALDDMVPAPTRSFIEGSISGDFRVFGSTNTSEGIGFEGVVSLDGRDQITLRDRIPLLGALSAVDVFNKYRRLDFREGSFRMKTHNGGMEVDGVKLKAGDLFTLDGKMTVRLPTPDETQRMIAETPAGAMPPTFQADVAGESPRPEEDEDFTLRRAAEEAKRKGEKKEGEEMPSLVNRMGSVAEARRMEEAASERLSRTLRYEGKFRVTLPPDAFELATNLRGQLPADPVTGRIPMDVPIEGSLYQITLKQAEEIYALGKRH